MFGLKRDVSDRTVGGIRNPFVSEAAPLQFALITHRPCAGAQSRERSNLRRLNLGTSTALLIALFNALPERDFREQITWDMKCASPTPWLYCPIIT
jgi:hypothetical protein